MIDIAWNMPKETYYVMTAITLHKNNYGNTYSKRLSIVFSIDAKKDLNIKNGDKFAFGENEEYFFLKPDVDGYKIYGYGGRVKTNKSVLHKTVNKSHKEKRLCFSKDEIKYNGEIICIPKSKPSIEVML